MNNSFLYYISSGKYNIALFIIFFILFFHLYYKIDCNKESFTESFTDDETIKVKKIIRQKYAVDVESLRNLTEVAIKLKENGLTIPANLTVTGTILSLSLIHI